MDPQTEEIGKEPEHNIHSDTSDAFQCFAMAALGDVPKKKKQNQRLDGWPTKLAGVSG